MENNQKGNTSLSEGTDPDFVWQDYLDETKSVAAAATAFSHVEYSLESAFKVGMKLEVPNPDDKDAYWIVSVIMTCGDLLTLRYAGYGDDRSSDFWFNIKSGEFHPTGWCSSNNKKLWPPNSVLQKHPDVNALLARELWNTESIPSTLTEDLNAGFMPIEQIKCGMKLEINDELNPRNIWIATIMQNVGGRLLLEYDVPANIPSKDVWLFYLSDRLFPIGYAKEHNYLYSPPSDIKGNIPVEQWDLVLLKSLKQSEKMPFPAHLFEPKIPIEKHEFKVGMKLEALNTQNYSELCPATVVQVIDEYYFSISFDSHAGDEGQHVFCCHSNSPFIFPIKWAEENGLELTVPKGYMTINFSWDEYLIFCSAKAAPIEIFPMMHMNMGFEDGMKLEAADPLCPNNIHAATIKKVAEPLMWLHFDSEENEEQFFISSVTSFDVFPVGWCASNFYPLKTPSAFKAKIKMGLIQVKEEPMDCQETPVVITSNVEEQYCSRLWCPKIYFNHRCFTGPLLSKGRLAELPQAIGPGPLHLVITDVIYRVVKIAYISSRVLQLLQIDGEPTPGMEQQVIKAKYKGKTYRATIEVITNSEQVEEFCKNICLKLECCPYLFSPKHVGEACPINCHTQTKTKFGYNFVKKKKKLGRPPLANKPPAAPPNPTEGVKRGRKKKKKHWSQLANLKKKAEEKKGESVETSEIVDNSKGNSKSDSKETPKCDSKTDGGDVPKSDTKTDSKDVPKTDTKDAPKSDTKTGTEDVPKRDTKTGTEDVPKSDTKTGTEDVPKSDTKDKEPPPPKIPLLGKKKLKHTPSSSIVTRGAKLPNFGLWHHHHATSFHSRRGRPRTKPFGTKKLGRPVGSTKEAMAQLRLKRQLEKKMEEDEYSEPEEKTPSKPVLLESNPLDWSVEDVVQYLKKTEYAPLAPILKDQEIDGQALLMLNLFSVREYLHLKPEPAEKFCYLIKNLKVEFFTHFFS